MNENIGIILEQIRNILLNKPIPDGLKTDDEEFAGLEEAVLYLSGCMTEVNAFLKSVAEGNLETEVPGRHNLMAGALKELHASLKHLAWQANQVANGDYSQHVSFMGEFSDSFNRMVSQLAEREAKLKEQSVALAESVQLMKSVMDGMKDWIVVMEKDSGKIIYENEAAGESFYDEQTKRTACGLPCELLDQLRREARGQGVWEFQCPVGGKTLRIRSFLVQWNENLAYAHHITDVTNEKAYQEQIETMAFQDELTRVYNRRYTMARLEELLRQKQGFAFCMLDLDHLKAVNDTLGHHAGDNYIRSVIAELQKIVRFSDIIGRIGGDEFSVILPDCSESSAEEKMLLLNERLRAGKEIYPMSVSYGVIYVEPEQKLSAETVMARADGKMYQSKKSKK